MAIVVGQDDARASALRVIIMQMVTAGAKAEDIRPIAMEWGRIVARPPMPELEVEAVLVDQLLKLVPPAHDAAHDVPDIDILDLVALSLRDPPQRAWVVQDWIGVGHVTSLYGVGGVGKSLLAMQIAVCAAIKESVFGFQSLPSRVLGIFGEDDDQELHGRLHWLCKGIGVDMSALAGRFDMSARAGKDNILLIAEEHGETVRPTTMWDSLVKRLRTAVERDKDSYRLVILDNIAQLIAINENRRTLVTQSVNYLTRLALQFNVAVLLLGHPSKGDASEYSGSTAWDAAVRSRLYLERDGDQPESELVLRKAKANYSTLDAMRLRYDKGCYRRTDAETDDVVENIRRRKIKHDARESIFVAMRTLFAEGFAPTHVQKSWNRYLPGVMADRGWIPEGINKFDLAKELRRMIDDGAIVVVPWKDGSRRASQSLSIGPGHVAA